MNIKGKNKKVVLDESQIAQVEALAAYFDIERIAQYFGFSKTTFYEIKKRQPKLVELYMRGRMKAHTLGGDVVMSFMKAEEMSSTKLDAAKFYLTHQAGWAKAEFVPPKQEPQELKLTLNVLRPKGMDE